MSANAKSMSGRGSSLPTLEDVDAGRVTLDEYEIAHGEDVPEWTPDDFARARPVPEFPDLARSIESAREELRARGERGPQKAPTKERVTLRLDREVVERYRQGGPGWQTRLNDDLVKLHKRPGHG